MVDLAHRDSNVVYSICVYTAPVYSTTISSNSSNGNNKGLLGLNKRRPPKTRSHDSDGSDPAKALLGGVCLGVLRILMIQDTSYLSG